MGPGHNWAWDIFGMGHIWPRDIFGMGHIWQDINGSGTYLVHMGHKWSGHVWPLKNLRTWLAGTCLGDIHQSMLTPTRDHETINTIDKNNLI